MYQTGTATSVADLLNKIRLFCTSTATGFPGYFEDSYTTDGTGHRLHISKNNYLVNFRSFVNENLPAGGASGVTGIYMNASPNLYNPSKGWFNQDDTFTYNNGSGYVITGINKLSASTPSYHFFYFTQSSGGNILYDVVYIIIENPAGSYQRLMFGILETNSINPDWYNNLPIGLFYSGSVSHTNPNSSMSLSFLGGPDNSWSSGSPSGAVYGNFSQNYSGWASGDFNVPQSQMNPVSPQVFDISMKLGSILLCSPNTFNSMPPLIPVSVFSTDPTATTMGNTTPWYPIGNMPFIYMLNIFNISPGSDITIGSDTYKVFPMRKKSDTWASNNPDNGTYRFGYAIKTS